MVPPRTVAARPGFAPEVGRFLDALDQGLEEVKVRARRVPWDRAAVRLAPDVRSAVDLLLHVAEVEGKWVVRGLAGGTPTSPAPSDASAEALFAHLDAVRRETAEALRAVADRDLEAVRDVPGKGPTTIRRALVDLLEHQAHHRGQLGTLARLLRAEGPRA